MTVAPEQTLLSVNYHKGYREDYRESIDISCTGILTFRPDYPQPMCDTCGDRERINAIKFTEQERPIIQNQRRLSIREGCGAKLRWGKPGNRRQHYAWYSNNKEASTHCRIWEMRLLNTPIFADTKYGLPSFAGFVVSDETAPIGVVL